MTCPVVLERAPLANAMAQVFRRSSCWPSEGRHPNSPQCLHTMLVLAPTNGIEPGRTKRELWRVPALRICRLRRRHASAQRLGLGSKFQSPSESFRDRRSPLLEVLQVLPQTGIDRGLLASCSARRGALLGRDYGASTEGLLFSAWWRGCAGSAFQLCPCFPGPI